MRFYTETVAEPGNALEQEFSRDSLGQRSIYAALIVTTRT